MTDLTIGKNPWPDGPVVIVFSTDGPANPSRPGGSSSKTTSPLGVFCGVPAVSSPPKATRRSEVITEFQTLVASRICDNTEGKLSLGVYEVGPESETKNVRVLSGKAVKSNFS